MKRVVGVILAVVALGALGFGAYALGWIQPRVNYDNYDANALIAGDQYNGDIDDHVKGNPEAPVLIFEYADYQCPGCATTNPRLNKLLDEYGDQIGLVYRNYLLSYHQNGTAAASAAEAAAMQGYWAKYADYLFSNQSAWEYASAKDRGELFTSYFETVTEGAGDLSKFESDMQSSAVAKKIRFDMALGNKIGVSATPTIIIAGEKVDFSQAGTEDLFLKLMREKIDAALKDQAASEAEQRTSEGTVTEKE